MHPIHPDHRTEAIAELEDIAQSLRSMESLTYDDLTQRLTALVRCVEVWTPTELLDEIYYETRAIRAIVDRNYERPQERPRREDCQG